MPGKEKTLGKPIVSHLFLFKDVVRGENVSWAEKMERKSLKHAEKYMKKAEEYAIKLEHSYSARAYEDAASAFAAASDTSSQDKALRLASKQHLMVAEHYINKNFKFNLIGFAYKSACTDLEKLTNKTDLDLDGITKTKKLAEEYLNKAVSNMSGQQSTVAPSMPGHSENIATYNALKRVTNDKTVKESMEKKIAEDTIGQIESNKNEHGILASLPLGGFNQTSDLRRKAINYGVMPASEFLSVYESAMKSILYDEKSKAYVNAAYRSMNLAKEASEKGFTDIANEMASKALELYTEAEGRLKKGNTKEYSKIKEGEAKAYAFMGKETEKQKAIQDAMDGYEVEAQWHLSKKKLIDAQIDLEFEHALAVKYGLNDAADKLNKRIVELKAMQR
jgi:HEPN domain-containing protein